MQEFLDTELFGTDISVAEIGYVLLAIVVGVVLSSLINLILLRISKRADSSSIRGAVVTSLDGPLRWSIIVASLWIAYVIIAADNAEGVLRAEATDADARFNYGLFLASEMPLLMWFASRLTDRLTALWGTQAKSTDDTFDDQLVPVVKTLSKISILIVGVLVIVQNLGGEVGSVLAGLGIGGAAIALASKDTIANLFGSIVIFIDRPFQIGDWVEIGDQEGTVEAVGLRVTRIRTFANSLITVPNSALTTTAINNWSRMRKRRIKLTLGVTYSATPEQLQEGVKQIREVLEGDTRVSQDFMLVNFTNFGASSLDIFVYAFTTTTRWDEYMQVRQELLLEFMRRFRSVGLSFAFPSQSLYVESLPPGAPDAMQRELPH
ncbi:Small-conductance mechanosensitive channel [Enhygromyxa salina]|uniref:Small-conductance mechanosensitive channel n=1 Tax=Enhygromyxa salina TaxID=215803 RepID=A0A0C2CQA1_9BACT|nr:mechanosensitive ion channel family protein [Enhygromyxa salina]KIG13366.1 Small-conductance mechanosensitive channel [Enhygromyxa salina]